MPGYRPIHITGNKAGLVQGRQEMILPNDAYPKLLNAYVWREQIKKKLGTKALAQLQRSFSGFPGNTNGSGNFATNIRAFIGLPATATLVPGSFTATVGGNVFTETSPPTGNLLMNGLAAPSGSFINWATTSVGLVTGLPATPVGWTVTYYPGTPVMGILDYEQTTGDDLMLVFDQVYCYTFNSSTQQFQEYIVGTNWNAAGLDESSVDFFSGTDYWVSNGAPFGTVNSKLFWVTNNSGHSLINADPIRITDGASWVDFSPANNLGQIDATNYLLQCLTFESFRGRLLAFNTWEGPGYNDMINFPNRIRWSTVGNPLIPYSAGPPAKGSWRDDIQGQGGYLDIPSNGEDITGIGVVRDNLVIYCEQSTWQLRYTGRAIAPFQIERVNSELGAFSLQSAVQFDTSLIGVGDKGVVKCDSYKSEKIDIKIPDLVFNFATNDNGRYRVHGIRDFKNRIAYWTYNGRGDSTTFPTNRLIYNYENDSWAIFEDSITALGYFYPSFSTTWLEEHRPWIDIPEAWVTNTQSDPLIVAGNQQGYISYLDSSTYNDVSLTINDILPHGTTQAVTITSINHNLVEGQIISISGIVGSGDYLTLNDGVYSIVVSASDKFDLYSYDDEEEQFSAPVFITSGNYVGGGKISVVDNFSVVSKKFNYLEQGESIQFGYLDILMSSSGDQNGAIAMNVYLDYDDGVSSNTYPKNEINDSDAAIPLEEPDLFFNSVIPTSQSTLNQRGGTKFWQRVYCPTRSNFITLEYKFSNLQMSGRPAQLPVQIDAQVLWMRPAGNMTQT